MFSCSLEGIALVTGARGGIGRGIALAFADAGADVAVCDYIIEDGELNNTAEAIRLAGHRSLAVQADVSSRTDVERMVRQIESEFGRIDFLINNAGVTAWSTFINLGEDTWDRVMNINLKGCYLCCREVAKGMAERKRGNIINVASAAVFGSLPRLATADALHPPEANVYSVSKAGIVMLTKKLARELAPLNIRVNAIAPGPTITVLSSAWENPEAEKRLSGLVPLGRMAQPIDIAGPAVFLASGVSNFITGQTLVIDGGLTT